MDYTLDSLRLKPFENFRNAVFEEYDLEDLFSVDPSMNQEILTEASDANKKNVFQKLWGLINKARKFIVSLFKKIINGIKKMFRKNSKSSNAIAEEIGLPKAHGELKLPEGSDLTPEQERMAKDAAASMYASFIKDFGPDGITIVPAKLVEKNMKSVAVKGKIINAGGSRASQVLYLIKDSTPLDRWIEFFTKLTDENNKTEVSTSEIDRVYSLCKGFTGLPSNASYAKDAIAQHQGLVERIFDAPHVKIAKGLMKKYDNVDKGGKLDKNAEELYINTNDLIEFQKKIDRCCELGEKFDNYFQSLNVNLGPDDSQKFQAARKHYMEILNDLAWVCVNLQGGIQAICNGLTGVYTISPEYWGQCNTPEMLAKFVEEAIKTGMPSKYIVNNIYRICAPNLKGNPNMDSPIMGFGRLTLIPEGDIIYKVAINGYGIRSNKNDFIVLDAVRKCKDPNFINRFADTVKTYGNYAVNIVEKVKAGKANEPSMGEAKRLAAEINNQLEQNGIGLEIVDIKSDAFGKRGDAYVILDYGFFHRKSASDQNTYHNAVLPEDNENVN